jgi:hypothetical protein
MRNFPSGLFSAAFLAHAVTIAAMAAPLSPFAVVELFTSEGCSSCPPADRLLSELAAQADKEGKPVFVLSFHVDYWNQLGWADPFSRPEFTRRQQRYSETLDGRVYTPQMIVNGTDGFVGSQGAQARRGIASALERSAGAAIVLTLEPVHPVDPIQALEVGYRVTGAGAGDLLNLALVEKGLSVKVKRGENGGRTLKHDNVVREFRTLRLDAKGEGRVRMALPAEMRADKAALIAYVQQAATLKTLGAAKAELQISK